MDNFDPADYTDHDSDYPYSSEEDTNIRHFDYDTDDSYQDNESLCICALCCLEFACLEFARFLEFAEPDYNLSDEFCVDQDSCDDFYSPEKLARPGKPQKDRKRLDRKKKYIQFLKSFNTSKDLNSWKKQTKNKSLKANKKWQDCEMSQVLC
jgi:hypothetical protein